MGQCVSRKAGAVIAASGYSPSYRIMEKKKSSKNQSDKNGSSKRSVSCTRGTATSFGFKRKPPSGIPVPVTSYRDNSPAAVQRSKSVGPDRRHHEIDDDSAAFHQPRIQYPYPTSGRSTPRLAPPKKEASGVPLRTNRFGFRHQQPRYTNKVGDIPGFQNVSRLDQDRLDQFQNFRSHVTEDPRGRQSRAPQNYLNNPVPKPRTQFSNQVNYNNNNYLQTHFDVNRRQPETQVSKFTLQASQLPSPQCAKISETNSKIAKTAVNQSRKISGPTYSRAPIYGSSKDGSSTEDSGLGSQHGYSDEVGNFRRSRLDYINSRQPQIKPRKLNVVLNGQSFDVRDVGEEHTVTEISVIPLPSELTAPVAKASPSNSFVRERTSQYQRFLARDNRYADSTTSMSTTSSEGYDEGLGEEKVLKDRSRSEKVAKSSFGSDLSTPSSDEQEQEYGHGGEAMADEYSLCSADDFENKRSSPAATLQPCNTVTQTTSQQLRAISNAAKSGVLPKSTLRSVMLTIEDPAFAAVAATTTTLIDDETSPVDSLFDSPTNSVSHDVKTVKKEINIMEKSGNTAEDDGPGTPTNASNSLSLSEGKDFFDDEIEDQPGLMFDDTLNETLKDGEFGLGDAQMDDQIGLIGSAITNKICKSIENSPMHIRKLNRIGSVSTLSSCESIASDDLMLDFERSEVSSYGGNSSLIMQELDDATSLLEIDIRGPDAMKELSNLIGSSIANSANNNVTYGLNNNSNLDSGISNNRTSRLLQSRSSMDSSPRSVDNLRTRQSFNSPLKTPIRNTQSPSIDSGDEGSFRIDRGTYHNMSQDIVFLKTMLLKLKRLIQEESLAPFDNSVKNGLFYNLNENGSTTDTTGLSVNGRDNVTDEMLQLHRQVVLLQSQIEDKDRKIEILESQITKYQTKDDDLEVSCDDISSTINGKAELGRDISHTKIQTEKSRPISAGASVLLQSLPRENSLGSQVRIGKLE